MENKENSMMYTKLFFIYFVSIIYIFFSVHAKPHIYSFNSLRDQKQVLYIFNENRKTVSDDNNDNDFKEMIKTRIPGENVEHIAPITLKVIRDNGITAGFIVYYMQSAEKGIIWIVEVDATQRRKGYGNFLMHYAMKDLCSMGAQNIGLWVSFSNDSAKKMYESLGFIEKANNDDNDTSDDIYLEYDVSKKA